MTAKKQDASLANELAMCAALTTAATTEHTPATVTVVEAALAAVNAADSEPVTAYEMWLTAGLTPIEADAPLYAAVAREFGDVLGMRGAA